ncbi:MULTISPECIES: hypothetical protein [Segatella]|uniref:Uncharacterized protein n=2 Tax=Segatella TaxID=2974251 RepID=D8DZ75_9BACT|nr:MULTISPECIES: hypothetical protein [Segatella]EFI71317.1 hypothetical protein PBR_2787 [Segatella baroniae B14]UKK79281.1 hypothetical protein L6469_13025 [Segatella baroniae B14]
MAEIDFHASCFFNSTESLADDSEADWFDEGRHETKARANRMNITFFMMGMP